MSWERDKCETGQAFYRFSIISLKNSITQDMTQNTLLCNHGFGIHIDTIIMELQVKISIK